MSPTNFLHKHYYFHLCNTRREKIWKKKSNKQVVQFMVMVILPTIINANYISQNKTLMPLKTIYEQFNN